MKPGVKVYQKENNLHFTKILSQSIRDMYGSRFLSRQLAKRDIQAMYRQSFFGIFWAFITPLATALVWVVLNKTGTVRLSPTGIPYPIYAMAGTLLWSILVEAINAPITSTNAAKGVISKINFPKEALIIAGLYKLLFNSGIKIILLLVFVFVFGVGYHASMWLFPLAIVATLFVGTTMGLLITPIGLLYKDVSRIISVGMQFLMYATPVVYAIPKTGLMKDLMEWNPFSSLILTGRDLLTGVAPEYLNYFFIVVGCCLPLLLMALVFYRISIPIIVERMSS
jgi:homopolymeric O-antigen transport system permease protein